MRIDIEQVKSFIDENLNRVRKSQQVALHLNCPVEGLKRSFLKAESLSLSSYIRATRIERMKDQLQNSEKPCKVICLNLGLREDVGARLFKNVTGMTMESYRKLCRHDEPVRRQFADRKRERRNTAPRIVLTEGVIRQILSNTEGLPKSPAKQRSDILIQGPSN